MSNLRVLFAPDYRAGTPYQVLLAEALHRQGIEVSFLSDYRRGLPLFRGSRGRAPNIIHVHWPEKYFQRAGDRWDGLRVARYPLDLWLTARNAPIVLTAHNFLPHNRWNEPRVRRNVRYTAQRSKGIFAHSEAAKKKVIDEFSVVGERVHSIPFGDLAVTMGKPEPREVARTALGLPIETKLCLLFGTISPYKGIEELVQFWEQSDLPHRLVVVGPVLSDAYAARLTELARGHANIDLRFAPEWLSDSALRAWLSASDCVLFNYTEIFSSGAAALARSLGLPLLIPDRLIYVDLQEPHPHVFRFRSLSEDFRAQLERALATPSDYDLAHEWRQACSWDRVAAITASVYRQAGGPGH